MGFLLDTFAPIIQMLMYVCYAVYVLLGLVLIIVGIASLSKKLLTSFCVGIIIVGFCMLVVGGLAIWTTMQSNWLLMLVILLVDLVLFLVLFSVAVTALFISVGGGDPVEYLFDEYWADLRAADGYAKENGLCYVSMDSDLEVTDGNWNECRAFYGDDAAIKTGDEISAECWEQVYGYGGNCTLLREQMEIIDHNSWVDDVTGTDLTSGQFWQLQDMKQANWGGDSGLWDDDYLRTTSTLWSWWSHGVKGVQYWQDTAATTGVCQETTATLEGCRACWQECKANNVQIAKDNTKPAAVASLAIFFFFVITAALNSFCLGLEEENEDGEEEFAISGLWFILLCALNGVVVVLGLVLIIVGAVVMIKTKDDCPLEPQAECPTTAILLIILVGGGVFLTGVLVILGAVLKIKLLIVFSNLIFTVLCLVLLLITTGLGLAAGVLGEASTQYNDNWEEARDNIRKIGEEEVLDFCLKETCTQDKAPFQCEGGEELFCCNSGTVGCTYGNDLYCCGDHFDINDVDFDTKAADQAVCTTNSLYSSIVDDVDCGAYGGDEVHTCSTADYAANAACCEKSKDDCIDEIQDLVEDYANAFAISGLVVSVFMLVIIWFSYLSIRVWRADDGEDDDDDDDDE